MSSQRTSHVRYYLAFWLFVLSGIAFLDRTDISIAGIRISQEFGLGTQRLGWIFSAFLLGYAAFQVPAGWLAAKFGPRKVITIGMLCWLCATATTALLKPTMANAIPTLILVRFCLGIGESVLYPAANQFVSRWIPPTERGIINGLIFAGVGAGSGLTPPLLQHLVYNYGWRSAFYFSSSVAFVGCIVWFLISRDSPEQHPLVSPEELSVIRRGIFQTVSQVEEKRATWGQIFARKDLYALMGAYFSFGYVAWIFFSWFFTYMAQVRGLNLKASARFTMLPFLSMTICCLVGGWISDRLTATKGVRAGRCYLASVALLLTSVFLVLGSQVKSAQLAGIILAGGAGALYLAQSSYWSAAVDIAGRSSGIFSALINTACQIGGALTASLTPWLAARFGWQVSFGTSAVLALIAAGLWLLVRPDRPMQVS